MSNNEKNELIVTDEYNKTIEIREKRIGIVFKIIYVFALFFGAIFWDLNKRDFSNEFNIYVAESCALAFLMVMIISFIMYIIGEMKCMRLSPDSISKDQIKYAEISYSLIFFMFPIALFTSIISFSLLVTVDKVIMFKFLNFLHFKGLIVLVIFHLLTFFIRDGSKRMKVRQVFSCVILTILIINIFLNIGTITANIQMV